MVSETQPSSCGLSIPFAISHDQQSFRLFELPDELVALVADGSRPRLHLKSAMKEPARNGSAPGLTLNAKLAEYVHLCSEDLRKTWSIRQVSTSNEVYIVQALNTGSETPACGDTVMGDAGQASAILNAVAKADSMLELLPATIDIDAHLRKLLPVYDRERLAGLFEDHSETPQFNEGEEHARLLSQIPAPDISIWEVWQQLCVSRCPGSREGYFIPTVQLLETAWYSALATYTIRASGTEDMVPADFEDDDDGAGELLSVKYAISQHICSNDNTGMDRSQVVTWVVRTLWQSMWEVPSTKHRKTEDRLEIEDLWRSALPRAYAAEATVDKLKSGSYELYEQEGADMIRWIGPSKVIPATQPPTANPGKRKWHDKFRESRNVKA